MDDTANEHIKTDEQTEIETVNEALATPGDVVDDLLDKAMDAAGIGDEPESGPKRDANGRFVSTKTREDESQQDESEAADSSNNEDWQKAYDALKREKVPNLDQIAKDNPEAFIEWGLERAKVQADVDGYTAKYKAAQARLAELEKKAGESQQDEPTAESNEADEIAKPFVEAMSEQFGEDFREPAKQMVDALLQRMGKQSDVNPEVDSLKAEIQSMREQQARDALLPHYPKLKERSEFDKLLATANGLSNEQWPDLASRLDAAAKIQYADDLREAAKREKRRANAAKDAGSPPPSGGKSDGVSLNELVDARLDAALDSDRSRAAEVTREINRRY